MSEAKYHSKLPMMAGKFSVTEEEAVRAGLQLDVDVVVVNTTLRSSGYDGLDASKEILAKKDWT